MKQAFKPLVFALSGLTALFLISFISADKKTANIKPTLIAGYEAPKIQAAILLDVSGSMSGLIEQAKAQLWNMVSTMGKAQCNGQTPKIEIALYEYGRSTNSVSDGYVKKLNGFINDLDSLSQNLFKLTTNGGDEYCGQVIFTAIKDLQWDASPESYKVIFIAGNEDFLQGNLLWTKACEEAKKKGVIVNTIYCGNREQGIREHWNLNSECGNGSFTVINHNNKIDDIPTPYDSILYSYNDKLNGTYVGYGKKAEYYAANQAKQDQLNASMSKSAGLKRIKSKSDSKVYDNAKWDLVDAVEKNGDGVIDKMDKEELPDSLKNKSKAEIKKIVAENSAERGRIQKEIKALNTQRDAYIAAEKAKNATKNNASNLETEVEKIIKEQAKRFNMKID